ncbi:S10 family peptidase [Aquabacterium sp.]|uniref:S10 family peptidase n=1 Tax=Aquabacterium sp. TaxID=1872578 RepID=UPI002BD5CD9A|nr:peptidase S10 [Aquabacterium sp.]HSW08247.1 peptidase S10 [Aquabacterium sp.]
MSDSPATSTKPESDGDKRQRERAEQLLARAPVLASGGVTLASGRRLDYAVRAAFVPVTQGGIDAQRGELQAAVFTIAYSVPAGDGTPRPVCFVFNGGPGSASIWLHLGALGPKRVPMNDDGSMPRAPYAVVDNPLTWLEHFDLVFIDPPHTGFSLSASDAARKTLLSVDGDVDALAEVMRGWLASNGRFGAPLYLAGESYGTTRGAALADKMQAHGLGFEGVILVSCAMDLQSLIFAPRNDLPYALYLPGFANVAQYHGRLKGALAASPEAARAAAEAFVAEDYLTALHAGSRLDGRARSRIEKRIAELTGLPPALVQEKNLRINDQCFFFDALRDEGRIVGRLEARVTGPMAASRTREWEFDPGIEALVAPYTTASLAYFASLGIPTDARYEVLSLEVNKAWNWGRGSAEGVREANGFTCTSTDLARALRRNPHLRVFVASGRYDLGTPYSASDWSLAQVDAPAEVLARITHRYYDAGHMFYTRTADLAQLKTDLASWLGAGSGA